MLNKLSLAFSLVLLLSACTTQSWQEASQRYEDWVKGTSTSKPKDTPKDVEAVKVMSVHKKRTLDELGNFDFGRRLYIYETLDEIANKLWKSPTTTILTKKNIDTFEKFPILELIDRDLDGQPDQFAYVAEEGGSTQEFGFFFDLNKDGRVDYLVFNGGPMFTQELKFYWMNYHWIDSNNDGRVDMKVNNAVSLEAGKQPSKPDLTVWLYDIDLDGKIDAAEYLGEGIVKPVPQNDGVLSVNWFMRDRSIPVGKESIADLENKILADINEAVHFTEGGASVPSGTTGVSASLQRDAAQTVMLMDMLADQECSSRKVVNTEIIEIGPGGKSGVERWTVNRCGKLVNYRVTFTPSPRGGTDFAVKPEK